MARPNSYRLTNNPMTKSCIRSVFEKQIVRRTNRLIRVRRLVCLLSIRCLYAFPAHHIGAIKYFIGHYNLWRGAAAALPVSHARFVDGYRESMGIRHVELAMLNSLDAPPG
jgi:hypothetical protein